MKATERIVQLKADVMAGHLLSDQDIDSRGRAYLEEAALVRGIGMYLDEEQVRREAWEKSIEERLSGQITCKPIPVFDPGPSKYDAEPEGLPE